MNHQEQLLFKKGEKMKRLGLPTIIICLFVAISSYGKPLPVANPDPESMFGVDKNINIKNIDEWLGRDDVAYIDVRMLLDPGDFKKIGGDPVLSGTIEGFEVVPYPYIANLIGLPPEVAKTQYSGPTLFTLTWDKHGKIETVKDNYRESKMIIDDLFPKDKAIFLLCGGGGYSSLMRSFLVKMGYDPKKIFVLGGFWTYRGSKTQHIKVSYGENNIYEYNAFHRLKYHMIKFDELHKI